MQKERCGWCSKEPLYIAYHDYEWGRAQYDEKKLFEMFILESMQAGLSWWTVLVKREAYRQALDDFDAVKIAQYDESDYERLMNNPALIRNRLKMRAIIHNAQTYLAFCKIHGGFSPWFWAHFSGQPLQNHIKTLSEIPVTTPLSDDISKKLKKFGFKFFGSTTCYAYMQAVGLVNDHVQSCDCYAELAAPRSEHK